MRHAWRFLIRTALLVDFCLPLWAAERWDALRAVSALTGETLGIGEVLIWRPDAAGRFVLLERLRAPGRPGAERLA